MAFILISTEMGSERKVLEELRKISEVSEAYIVYGVYDIVAKVQAPSTEALKEIISNRIRKLSKVRSTLTMVVVEGKKIVKQK